MKKLDFDKPITLTEALEAFSLALNVLMVRLREHVEFGDAENFEGLLQTMHFLSAMFEDRRLEIEGMLTRLEPSQLVPN